MFKYFEKTIRFKPYQRMDCRVPDVFFYGCYNTIQRPKAKRRVKFLKIAKLE